MTWEKQSWNSSDLIEHLLNWAFSILQVSSHLGLTITLWRQSGYSHYSHFITRKLRKRGRIFHEAQWPDLPIINICMLFPKDSQRELRDREMISGLWSAGLQGGRKHVRGGAAGVFRRSGTVVVHISDSTPAWLFTVAADFFHLLASLEWLMRMSTDALLGMDIPEGVPVAAVWGLEIIK